MRNVTMKQVVRNASVHLAVTGAVFVALWLMSYAFEFENEVAVAAFATLILMCFGGFAFVGRQLGKKGQSRDLLMSDEWAPRPQVNPATGYPMTTGGVDVLGNAYGFDEDDHHRRGG